MEDHPAIAAAIAHGAEQAVADLRRTRQTPEDLQSITDTANELASEYAARASRKVDELAVLFHPDFERQAAAISDPDLLPPELVIQKVRETCLPTEDDAISAQEHTDELRGNVEAVVALRKLVRLVDEQRNELTAPR